MEIFYFLVTIFGVLNMIAFVASILIGTFDFVNPFSLYKNIEVNWFGAFLIAIILNLLFPLISISYWIYKICTVGRK